MSSDLEKENELFNYTANYHLYNCLYRHRRRIHSSGNSTRNTAILVTVLLTEDHFSLIYPKLREIRSLDTILGV